MWAVKASGPAAVVPTSGELTSSSLLLPRYFLQPPPTSLYGGGGARHSVGNGSFLLGPGLGSHAGPVFGTLGAASGALQSSHHLMMGTSCTVAGDSNSAPSGRKRNKYHKIGPRTLNPPRLVNPYSRVPIRIGGSPEEVTEGECENGPPPPPPWERSLSTLKPVPSHADKLSGGAGLASPAQVLSLQASAASLTAARDRGGAAAADEGSGDDRFLSLKRLRDNSRGGDRSGVRNSGGSSCSGGSGSTSTTAAELSRLHPPPVPPCGRSDAANNDLLEDDAFSNDDYVDMTSDAGDEDGDESLDENYKALTDRALDHLSV
jgi:hypothetical protein